MEDLETRILSKATHKKFKEKTILLEENKIADTFIFIKSGVVRHFFIDEKGDDITKNFILAPAYFAYSLSSFLSKEKGIIQCQALTDIEVYELAYVDFIELSKDNDFLTLWNNVIANFIIKKEKKELALLKKDAKIRYLDFLRDFPGLINIIPHYYVASYLSIAPETLSRIRKTFPN